MYRRCKRTYIMLIVGILIHNAKSRGIPASAAQRLFQAKRRKNNANEQLKTEKKAVTITAGGQTHLPVGVGDFGHSLL